MEPRIGGTLARLDGDRFDRPIEPRIGGGGVVLDRYGRPIYPLQQQQLQRIQQLPQQQQEQQLPKPQQQPQQAEQFNDWKLFNSNAPQRQGTASSPRYQPISQEQLSHPYRPSDDITRPDARVSAFRPTMVTQVLNNSRPLWEPQRRELYSDPRRPSDQMQLGHPIRGDENIRSQSIIASEVYADRKMPGDLNLSDIRYIPAKDNRDVYMQPSANQSYYPRTLADLGPQYSDQMTREQAQYAKNIRLIANDVAIAPSFVGPTRSSDDRNVTERLLSGGQSGLSTDRQCNDQSNDYRQMPGRQNDAYNKYYRQMYSGQHDGNSSYYKSGVQNDAYMQDNYYGSRTSSQIIGSQAYGPPVAAGLQAYGPPVAPARQYTAGNSNPVRSNVGQPVPITENYSRGKGSRDTATAAVDRSNMNLVQVGMVPVDQSRILYATQRERSMY